jgi:hypothetical protein
MDAVEMVFKMDASGVMVTEPVTEPVTESVMEPVSKRARQAPSLGARIQAVRKGELDVLLPTIHEAVNQGVHIWIKTDRAPPGATIRAVRDEYIGVEL